MSLIDLYSGYRPFSTDDEIISTVKRSKSFDVKQEDISKASKVQLLETSKQRTYLVSTGKRIYKIVDDRRSDRPKIAWSRKIDMVFDGRELKGNLVPRNESTYDLIIDATPGTTNLVSKNLFANIDFNDAIASLSLERGGDNHNNIRAQ